MYLKHVDIEGFRGINQLVLDLNPNLVMLIGENTWGKSSLLGALSLLSPENVDYQFTTRDFYQPVIPVKRAQPLVAKLRFTFSEMTAGQFNQPPYQAFNTVMDAGRDKLKQITYQISATLMSDNQVVMQAHFLNVQGKILSDIDHVHALIQSLCRLRPIMRLKNPLSYEAKDSLPKMGTDQALDALLHQLKTQTKLSKEEVYKGLQVGRSLIEYYLVDRHKRESIKRQSSFNVQPTPTDWTILDRFNHALDELPDDYARMSLLAVFTGLCCSEGGNILSPEALPILLLEEPESQLHPIILSVAMHLLSHLPVQKIMTTNSSDTVALAELTQIYRLKRYSNQIEALHLNANTLSESDARRIKFHILYRRASALFARTWLMVEGETEVWILRELAEQSGYYLNAEGIQIIEFAQSGLKTLIKYAEQMGIGWHVLTDGDLAGKKYADTVKSLCPPARTVDDYLTILPAKDIENFLFRQGFSHVYKMMAYDTNAHIDLPVSHIIQKAIHKSSKPDLAVAICDDARARGAAAIPQLFKQMFARIVKLL